jgi:hypothetical protein
MTGHVEPEQIRFPKIPNFRTPAHVWQARRLNYGPDYLALGVMTFEPPKIIGKAFSVRRPQIDPQPRPFRFSTHMGWNLAAIPPNPDTEMANLAGSYISFPKTRAERERTGDARRSIEERYPSKDDYLKRVDAAAKQLVADRYLLSSDLPRIHKRPAAEWDTLAK